MSAFIRLVAHAHPALVHFPIAALLLAALARWVARDRARGTVHYLLGVAVIGGIPAAVSGMLLAPLERVSDVGLHRALGLTTLAVTVAAAVVSWRAPARPRLLTVLLTGAAALAAATGHAGGELVFGHGWFSL